MKKVISFWENQSKNGNTYYTGKLGELDLIGFKNLNKKNQKEPDITFYVKEDKPKQEQPKEDPYTSFAKEIEITEDLLD